MCRFQIHPSPLFSNMYMALFAMKSRADFLTRTSLSCIPLSASTQVLKRCWCDLCKQKTLRRYSSIFKNSVKLLCTEMCLMSISSMCYPMQIFWKNIKATLKIIELSHNLHTKNSVCYKVHISIFVYARIFHKRIHFYRDSIMLSFFTHMGKDIFICKKY